MVTVVNTPAGSDEGSGAGGWAVATVVIILVVLALLFLWPRLPVGNAAPQQPDAANINVTVPTGGAGGGDGGTGGGNGGAQQ